MGGRVGGGQWGDCFLEGRMKKKVSMLSTLPPTKGLSPYTLGLVKELSKNCGVYFFGFKSIYPEFLYPGGTKTNEKEPQVKNVSIMNTISWYNPFSWIKTGYQIDTEILHAQWWSWALAPMYLTILGIARAGGKKIIMTIHNVKPHEKSWLKNFLNSSVINLAGEYIVHSEDNRKLFQSLTKTKKKISVIPHGTIEMGKPSKSRKDLRKLYKYTDSERVLLFFGNIRDYKGLDVILISLSKIKDGKVKLIIAGSPWKSFDEYTEIINKLKLQERVKTFLGFNPETKIAELFTVSDLVVFPYKEFEASSGAGTVALNFEKPMVVTDVGGLPDIVKDKGVVAKPKDSDDLKDKIVYALKNLKKLEKDSKEKAKEFSWKEIAKKTGEVYGR